MASGNGAIGLKAKAVEELKVFWVVAAFLALMFGAFTTYRRLILSEFGITYVHYGAGVVEALIVVKVILIGQALGIGKRFEKSSLLVAAGFKALLYGALVAAFAAVEHWIEGLAHGKNLASVWRGFIGLGKDEIFARTLMVIVAFLPFFAFWETNRALGQGKLFALLLPKRASQAAPRPLRR
jgi:hypothetical protein